MCYRSPVALDGEKAKIDCPRFGFFKGEKGTHVLDMLAFLGFYKTESAINKQRLTGLNVTGDNFTMEID